MRRLRRSLAPVLLLLPLLAQAATAGQRYAGTDAPPTAPAAAPSREPRPAAIAQPIMPVSTGMGAIQFFPVNYGASAPQSLTRQLLSDDERTRQTALVAMGAPSQYTAKGHVPFAHSVQLELAALGTSADLDALLTVELDHHLVTAVLMPDNGDWRRIATVLFPTSFADPSTTPSTFLHTTRSLLEPDRYRAIFRARETQADGNYVENEAHLRILNNHAVITSSFVDEARTCAPPPANGKSHASCEMTRRWLQPDLNQPGVRRFQLVTATGSLSGKDESNPMADSRDFQFTRLKNFTCQPFAFSDSSLRYEPTSAVGPCKQPGAK
jgi:hypothetical protein